MITIAKNKEGMFITPSKKNAEFGYINLQSVERSIDSATGWVQKTKRSCLLKGEIADLEAMIADWNGKIPGKIVVNEFIGNAIPAKFKANLDKSKDLEDAILPFLKQTAEDGVVLTFEDAPIVRFSSWDPTGQAVDVKVQHDNIEEVNQWRAEVAAEKANLPV